MARLAELGREGLLLLCGDSTNGDRPGFSPSEKVAGPNLQRRLQPLQGPHRRDVVRLEHPPRPAGRRRRRGARAQGLPRRALDAQEHEHRPLAGAHQGPRRDDHRRRASSTQFPDEKIVDHLDRVAGRAAERAAPDGPPRPPAGRAARGRHGRLQRDADPRQRARGQRDDRPPVPHRLRRHHDARRADPRLRPRLSGGDQAHAQPDPAEVRHAVPRRLQAHPPARAARRVGRRRRPRTSSRARTACRSSSTAKGARWGTRSSRG